MVQEAAHRRDIAKCRRICATSLIQVPVSTYLRVFRNIMTGSGHFKPVASIVFATNGVGNFGSDTLASLLNPFTNSTALFKGTARSSACRSILH